MLIELHCLLSSTCNVLSGTPHCSIKSRVAVDVDGSFSGDLNNTDLWQAPSGTDLVKQQRVYEVS
jgi:hypothetical protein